MTFFYISAVLEVVVMIVHRQQHLDIKNLVVIIHVVVVVVVGVKDDVMEVIIEVHIEEEEIMMIIIFRHLQKNGFKTNR